MKRFKGRLKDKIEQYKEKTKKNYVVKYTLIGFPHSFQVFKFDIDFVLSVFNLFKSMTLLVFLLFVGVGARDVINFRCSSKSFEQQCSASCFEVAMD